MNHIEAMKQALEAMNAMLTHMGMDEDEWNKVTFNQMRKAITSIRQAIADLEKQEPVAWKLVPIKPTREMLEAMDECSIEGYDEHLYAGHAASVYMAAVDVAPTPPQPKEPEQEPVATLDDLEQEIYENTRQFVSRDVMEWILKRYYTTPPQRKPLTRGQIREIEVDVSLNPSFDYITPAEQLCRAIEAAHNIKE